MPAGQPRKRLSRHRPRLRRPAAKAWLFHVRVDAASFGHTWPPCPAVAAEGGAGEAKSANVPRATAHGIEAVVVVCQPYPADGVRAAHGPWPAAYPLPYGAHDALHRAGRASLQPRGDKAEEAGAGVLQV